MFKYLTILMLVLVAVLGTSNEAPVVVAQAIDDNAPKEMNSEVERIVARIGKRRDRLWTYAYELQKLAGPDYEDAEPLASLMMSYIEHPDSYVQVVACQVILTLGESGEEICYKVLADLIQVAPEPDVVAACARLIMLFEPEDSEAVLVALDTRLEKDQELGPQEIVALTEAQAYLGNDYGIERLRSYLTSTNRELVNRSALALARVGYLDEVRGRLEALRREAGSLGMLADIALENARTEKNIELLRATGEKEDEKDPVAQVATLAIKNYAEGHYYRNNEREAVSPVNLVDNAARGLVGSVDPFSEFLTSEDFRKMSEDQSGSFAGIGANVTKRDEDPAIRVSQPIYEGPAYKAGLRTGDLLWEYEENGVRKSLVGMDTTEGVKYLRGPIGTKIKLWVKRPGVENLVELEITRAQVNVDTALESTFPGNIGYVNLTRFGGKSAQDLFVSLKNLDRQKVEGLILDLRDNPGGALDQVLAICDLFLPDESPIVKLDGVWGPYANPQVLSAQQEPLYGDIPLVVLIDESSASGAELLSGSMKDHKRGLVIGEKSFGKGIGQSFYPITGKDINEEMAKATGRFLKCTVFHYFVMPSEISVDRKDGEGGVTPNIEVHSKLYSSWEFYRLAELQKSEKVEAWVRSNWDEHKERFLEIAEFDGYSEERYPGFEDFYQSLNTKLSREIVRNEIRRFIRALAADERAYPYYGNYQIDYQLQRGIIELARKMKLDISKDPHYAPFIKDHPAASGK